MKIFINISHPAHVHIFKNFIKIMGQKGHQVIIGARNKEFTKKLLDYYQIDYIFLTNKGKGTLGLFIELVKQQVKLYRLIKKYKFDIMLQIGGIFNAPIGKLMSIPTIAISDTENDKIGNKISFKLSKFVLSPDCWDKTIGGEWPNQLFYPSYHELAYLSPKYFSFKPRKKNKFLLRFVGWGAGHDIGEKYLSEQQKIEIVNILNKHGEVYISSEKSLPKEIEKYNYKLHPAEVHRFMVDCKLIVGESATMASEAACMGIPSVFISNTGRGYTTEQNKKYRLVYHYNIARWPEIKNKIKNLAINQNDRIFESRKDIMLKEKIDFTEFLCDFVTNYPTMINQINFAKYNIIE